YVSDPEINEIIADIATDSPDYVTELVELPTGDEVQDFGPTDPRDELFNQGVEYIIRESMRKGNGKGSISWLQRKMKIGYQRSARLFDYMEEDGIVGPGQGQQPRDVLISLQEWRRRLAELKDAEEQTSGFRGQASGRNDEPRSRKPGLKTRKDDAHESDRSPKPKVRPDAHRVGDRSTGTKPKELLTGVPVRSPKPQVEPGVGKIDEVDDSMLAEVRPNVRQRQKPPGGKRLQASDSWLQESASNTNPEVRSPMPNNNVYGVVPVADGDVTDDADGDEWEYEYEYVYEEVDADDGDEDAEEDAEEEDSDEEEGEGEGEEEDWDDGYVDPKARYVEEMNIEDGGEWEAEEDWDETETNQPDEEEYDEYDDEYDED
ncbi:MAG: hypothetical protein FWD31_09255, partial [Planctomycetaceae bacterium]|nr:hypothetical protein [Planctomycetaceae bacterium]